MTDSNEQSDQAKTQTHETNKDEKANTKKLMGDTSNILSLFFSLCLVVASFLTFLAICIQAFIYNYQLKEMKKSTDSTTKAANATVESVDLMRENTRREQRAWITVTKVSLVAPLSNGQPPVVKVEMRNSGKTPAMEVRMLANAYFAALPGRIDENGEPSSLAVIGPEANWYIDMHGPEPITEENIENVRSGLSAIYASGAILYRDIFKKEHRTNFCFLIKGGDLGGGVLGTATTGNSIDEE